MNWWKLWVHHLWHGKPWKWLPVGNDAICHLCGYRVKGAGEEAELALWWEQADPGHQHQDVKS